jgi:Flagellar hook-length control protein FliK
VFGVAHATRSVAHRADAIMETIPVQSAGATTPTPPASGALGGIPVAGKSFSLTLDRALGSQPTPILDAPISDPSVSPRQKPSRDNSTSDSSTVAGLLMSGFIASYVQPAPPVASGTPVDEPHLRQEGTTATTQSTFAPTLPAPFADEQGQNVGTATPSAAPQNVANLRTLSHGVGRLVGQTEPSDSEGSIPIIHGGRPIPTNRPNRVGSTPSPQLAETKPVRTPEIRELPAPNGPVDLQIMKGLSFATTQEFEGAHNLALSESPSKQSYSLHIIEAMSPPPNQVSQVFPSAPRSLPPPERHRPLQTQATPAPVGSTPQGYARSSSLAEPAVPGTAPETTVSASEFLRPLHSETDEVSSWLAKFTAVEVNLQVPKTESGQPAAPQTSSPVSPSATHLPASNEPLQLLSGSPQTQSFPQPDDLVNHPVKGASHSGLLPSTSTLETVTQKAQGLELADPRDPLPSTPSTAQILHLSTDPHPAVSETNLHKEAVTQDKPIRPSTGSVPRLDASPATANLSAQTKHDEAKLGQQSAPSTVDIPTVAKPSFPEPASHAASDAGTNLLTAQPSQSHTSHAASSLAPPTPPAGQPPATLAAWQNYEGGAGRIVKSAWLNDSAGGTEMHVEFRSGPLGLLEVHAVVNHGSVGAEIHVEGHEAHSILTAGLPSLERALGERNLHVGNIAIHQDQAGGGMSGGERQNHHSGPPPSPQRQTVGWDTSSQPSRFSRGAIEVEEGLNPVTGLSVRA